MPVQALTFPPASRAYTPGPLLAPFIEAIELPVSTDPLGSSAGYTVLPSPQPVLGLQLRGQLAIDRGGQLHPLAALGVSGLQTVARRFVPEAGTRTLIVRFRPYGAAALLGPRQADLVDQSVEFADLLPGPVEERLRERLASTKGEREALIVLLKALADPLARGGADVSLAVRLAADAIVREHGNISVTALASDLGIGVRRLERGFHSAIGLSPKQLAGVARFAWAAEQLHGSGSAARIAHDAGFADQAQMSREFARRLGVAPSRWRATR